MKRISIEFEKEITRITGMIAVQCFNLADNGDLAKIGSRTFEGRIEDIIEETGDAITVDFPSGHRLTLEKEDPEYQVQVTDGVGSA